MELRQGNVLIRANPHLNPDNLTLDKWGERYAEVVWLEQWRPNNQAEMLAALFGGGKTISD